MEFLLQISALAETPPPEEILTRTELEKYSGLKVDKRRREWLAGRFAAKQVMLKARPGTDIKDIEVLAGPEFQPGLSVMGKKESRPLSITHSGDYAAAVLGLESRLIGVDLEVIETRPVHWAKEAFHPDEIRGGDGAEYFTRLWTVKEAVLKALGVGLKADLHEIRIIDGEPRLFGQIAEKAGSARFRAVSQEKPEGYILTVAEGGIDG